MCPNKAAYDSFVHRLNPFTFYTMAGYMTHALGSRGNGRLHAQTATHVLAYLFLGGSQLGLSNSPAAL
jgi:hypothetical protein